MTPGTAQARSPVVFRIFAVALLVLSMRKLAGADYLDAGAHIAGATLLVLFAFDAENRKGIFLLVFLLALGFAVADLMQRFA